MKKRLLVALMSGVMCFSAVPTMFMDVDTAYAKNTDDEEEVEGEIEDEDDDDESDAGEITKDDIKVSPSKKTIKKGKSFYIDIEARGGSEFEDLPDEEWEEMCENNIDSIEYRSTKSSVASVSSQGKVKGKKRGNAVIRTTVNLANGDSVTFKTKVYVTN